MILRKKQRKSKIKNLCVQACYADCACHQMRRKSWFLELVLLVVFSALLSTADGSLSTVLDLKLRPGMPNNVYYSLRGSPFVLNCTARVGNYAQASNLTWQHNKKWLFSEVRHIDNSTVQLTLSSTSSDNDGIYWCGPRLGNMSKGVNMSLIVADPPSPPRNLRYSVVGAMDLEREYRIFWSASSLTGGLPVNYTVKLCVNDSFAVDNNACNWSSNPDCRPTNVLSTDKDFVCVLNDSGDFVSPCEKSCNYTISVVAENAVGTVSSWQYLPFIPLYSATPWPPLSFNVVTTDKPNELRVSWMSRKPWRYTEMEYTILYHARNENENKTKVIHVSDKNTFTLTEVTQLSEKLKAFMEYYVYLTVRFVNEEGMKSAPSEVLGPRIVQTPAGKPDTPSKVIKDSSVKFPGNPSLRNVTVEWEIKRSYSWHGLPGKQVIYCTHRYVSDDPPPDCEYHVDATSNRAVLQRLDSAKSYKVFIKRCNKEQLCARSEPHIVKENPDNSPQRKNEKKQSSTKIIFISVSAAVVSLIVIGVAVYYWRRNWLHERAASLVIRLRDRVILQPPAPPYNYVEPLATDDYDQLCLNEDQP